MFKAYYWKERFKFIHNNLLGTNLIKEYSNKFLIPKTGCFYSDHLNFYIDTSDGVNDDLEIYEYCGRIKRVVQDCKGKPFLFFKSAYSKKWSKNIEKIAEENNGKIIPFFKWSFNNKFYSDLYQKRELFLEKYENVKKEYDIGIFFDSKKYRYPLPSETDEFISWSDHEKFGLAGKSRNMGYQNINSRKNIIDKLNNSKCNVLHSWSSYKDYIDQSFKCKIIINPPGIGEYTSRMVDQTYLGNCIVLRKNSYDNGLSWKKHIPEVDFTKSDWENTIGNIISKYKHHGKNCREYYENFWTPNAIVNYLTGKIND